MNVRCMNLYVAKCSELAQVRFEERKKISSLNSSCFVAAEKAKIDATEQHTKEIVALYRLVERTIAAAHSSKEEFTAAQAELQHAVNVLLHRWNEK